MEDIFLSFFPRTGHLLLPYLELGLWINPPTLSQLRRHECPEDTDVLHPPCICLHSLCLLNGVFFLDVKAVSPTSHILWFGEEIDILALQMSSEPCFTFSALLWQRAASVPSTSQILLTFLLHPGPLKPDAGQCSLTDLVNPHAIVLPSRYHFECVLTICLLLLAKCSFIKPGPFTHVYRDRSAITQRQAVLSTPAPTLKPHSRALCSKGEPKLILASNFCFQTVSKQPLIKN